MRYVPGKLLVGLLLLAPALYAQTMTPKTIVFDGMPEYQPAELLAASGLTPGKPVSKENIEAGMQRLDDTGLFAGIQYTTGNGVLRFALEPTAPNHMRGVSFANFVMYQPADLNAGLRARLPLYRGRVPVDGKMQEQVERALEAMLRERGVTATVRSIGNGGSLSYAIATPPVVVGKVAIEGGRLDSDASLGAVIQRVVGSEYVDQSIEGTTGDQLRKSLGEAYLDLGYQDEVVGKIGHPTPVIAVDRITVDLTGKADPGTVYTVSRVELPAAVNGVSAKDVEQATQLKVGGPASRILVLSTVARLNGAYVARGYLDSETKVEPQKDAMAHTMAYRFSTVPGGAYRMRNLTIAGMNPEQTSLMTGAWKLPRGAQYSLGGALGASGFAVLKTLCAGKPAAVRTVPERSTLEVDVEVKCGR